MVSFCDMRQHYAPVSGTSSGSPPPPPNNSKLTTVQNCPWSYHNKDFPKIIPWFYFRADLFTGNIGNMLINICVFCFIDQNVSLISRDCKDLQDRGVTVSGVYVVNHDPDGAAADPVTVYCNMETDGGGWMVSYCDRWRWVECRLL